MNIAIMPLICCAVALTGCGLDPEYMTRRAATVSDEGLMNGWHNKIELKRSSPMQKTAAMQEEIGRKEALKRGIVRPSMVDAIQAGKARIGMTRLEATAAWGFPRNINTTTTARGQREQWCYGGAVGSSYLPMSFLYFENGILTTIQN